MGAFFHAVAVFFEHLADVRWDALGLALACHVIKLLFRARAWQNIVRAAYPETPLIAVSGHFRSGLFGSCTAAAALGVRQVIAKPFSRRDLLAAVHGVIGPAG